MKTILFLLAIFVQTNAQPVLYPLYVGDIWQYKYTSTLPPDPTVISYRVGQDTIISGNTYKIIFSGNYVKNLVRQSGDSVFFYQTSINKEVLYYNFSKSIGDTISSTPLGNDTMDIVLTGINVYKYFGISRRTWSFYVKRSRHIVDIDYSVSVADSLGEVGRQPSFGESQSLVGAVINGKVYGNVVSVYQNNEQMPNDFILLQNYPNPFNSTTIVRFTLPKSLYVDIEIYNSIGKLIKEVAYTKMSAGIHEIHFELSHLTSGVYFYRVSTSIGIKVGKMILEK
jgi:hypothetical protein